mmetsp:Transcript_23552/g.51225  ORF Transcript_23552/g.51225 Transcript_23552/m.51225 type:complete len:691 (+) Transcript_23552:1005-3077(+)
MATQPPPEYTMQTWVDQIVDGAKLQCSKVRVLHAAVKDELERLRKRSQEHHLDDQELTKALKLLETLTEMLAVTAEESVAIPEEKVGAYDALVTRMIQETTAMDTDRSNLPSEAIDHDHGLRLPEVESEGDSINGQTEKDLDDDSDGIYQHEGSTSASGRRGDRESQPQGKVRHVSEDTSSSTPPASSSKGVHIVAERPSRDTPTRRDRTTDNNLQCYDDRSPSPKRRKKPESSMVAGENSAPSREIQQAAFNEPDEYSDEACEARLLSSLSHIDQRSLSGKRNFHLCEAGILGALAEQTADIIVCGHIDGPNNVAVQLGQCIYRVFEVLKIKRMIGDHTRASKNRVLQAECPQFDENASAADVLNVLDEDNTKYYNEDIKMGGIEAVEYAVKNGFLQTPGVAVRKNGNIRYDQLLLHCTAFGDTAKAFMLLEVSLFSLVHVAANVDLEGALDDEVLYNEAIRQAGAAGFKSTKGWTLGRFTFSVAVPVLAGDRPLQRQMAMKILTTAYFNMVTNESFITDWREYGDRSSLPNASGHIERSQTSTNFFSDENKGAARKSRLFHSFVALLQCNSIIRDNKIRVTALEGITSPHHLGMMMLRCSMTKHVEHTKLLKQSDLFVNPEKASKVKDFAKQLTKLLQSSEERKAPFYQYCCFLDLDEEPDEQIDLLLKVLGLPLSFRTERIKGSVLI